MEKKKGFFGNLMDTMDLKLKEKSKKKSCACDTKSEDKCCK